MLSAIRARCLDSGRPFPAALEAQLRADSRPGACAILAASTGVAASPKSLQELGGSVWTHVDWTG
jgi:hypothetical protein